jgi:hypothetical protein
MLEKTIWHDGKDWIIRRDGEAYSYCEMDSEEWRSGVPPGMTDHDAALLFDGILPV